MDIPASGNPVYQINARDGQDRGTSVYVAVRNNDANVDLDGMAEVIRAYLAGNVPDVAVSFIDKAEASSTALYPA